MEMVVFGVRFFFSGDGYPVILFDSQLPSIPLQYSDCSSCRSKVHSRVQFLLSDWLMLAQ